DLQSGRQVGRTPVIDFPGLFEAGDAQVGNGETSQARFRLGTHTRGAFVADFTARAGRGAGERSDGGRMVMRFHFGQDVDRLFMEAVLLAVGIREETTGSGTFEYGGVVFISRQHALAVLFIGV